MSVTVTIANNRERVKPIQTSYGPEYPYEANFCNENFTHIWEKLDFGASIEPIGRMDGRILSRKVEALGGKIAKILNEVDLRDEAEDYAKALYTLRVCTVLLSIAQEAERREDPVVWA